MSFEPFKPEHQPNQHDLVSQPAAENGTFDEESVPVSPEQADLDAIDESLDLDEESETFDDDEDLDEDWDDDEEGWEDEDFDDDDL